MQKKSHLFVANSATAEILLDDNGQFKLSPGDSNFKEKKHFSTCSCCNNTIFYHGLAFLHITATNSFDDNIHDKLSVIWQKLILVPFSMEGIAMTTANGHDIEIDKP